MSGNHIARHEKEKAEAARLYEQYQAEWIDHADDMRVIVTKRGEYFMPTRSARTWAEHRPRMTPLEKYEDQKFWPTPEGWILARPDDQDERTALNSA